jgi:hypothetical protein
MICGHHGRPVDGTKVWPDVHQHDFGICFQTPGAG